MSSHEQISLFVNNLVQTMNQENFTFDYMDLEEVVTMLIGRCKERLTFEVIFCCPYGFDESERFSVIYMDGVPVAAEYFNQRWSDTPMLKPTYYVGPSVGKMVAANQVCDMVFIEESIRHSVPKIQAFIDGLGPCCSSEGESFFALTNMARYEGELVWDKLCGAASNMVMREAWTVVKRNSKLQGVCQANYTSGQKALLSLNDEWVKSARVRPIK